MATEISAIESVKKIDDKTVEIEISQPTSKSQFTIKYLKEQRANVVAQKEAQIVDRDKELAQIDTYIAEALKLGIKE